MLFGVIIFAAARRVAVKIDIFFLDETRLFVEVFFWVSVLVLGGMFLCTPSQRIGEALYQRLFPVVMLLILVAIQVLIVQFLWMHKRLKLSFFTENQAALKIFAFVLLFFLLVWILIAWSGVGIDRGPSGWLSPGTPVLPQQLLFCVFLGGIFFVFRSYLDRYVKNDLILGAGIWLLTSAAWWLEPMVRYSYFTPKPTPPNFEYYPYSDAFHYDWFAQNLLIGASRNIGLTHRPLYSFLLALLHFLGGSGLHHVLFMQVIILATIPALVYMLASRLGGRPAGVAAALILLIREKNSIALTNIIEVSHVKLIMSDMPTMLTMVLFIYLFVRWFLEREDKYSLGALAGAGLGLSILIRSQAQLLIPIALLGVALIEKFNWKLFFQKSAVFLLGIAIVVVPWVWRNYQVSGRVVVEYLDFYTTLIASTYSSSPANIDLLPGETNLQYRDRVKEQVTEYILAHPAEVAHFYAAYFLHNEISSLAFLPMLPRFDSLRQYVDVVGFWDPPYLGGITFAYIPAFFFIVCLLAFGIAFTFQKFGWVGIMPLLFHLGYSFSSVPVRQSGWRFILPVDWIVVLYFCVGLANLGLLAYSLFSKNEGVHLMKTRFEKEVRHISWRGINVVLASFTMLGIAIPLVEWSIPEHYPALSSNMLIQDQVPKGLILENGEDVSALDLKHFLLVEADAVVMYGRALYPSYYEQGKFWGETNTTLLEASKYNRLQFNLIGSNNAFVFVPLQMAPLYFPHASDVFLVGCLQGDNVRALIIKANNSVLASSPWKGLSCSVTE
jgi:hypothetical protein